MYSTGKLAPKVYVLDGACKSCKCDVTFIAHTQIPGDLTQQDICPQTQKSPESLKISATGSTQVHYENAEQQSKGGCFTCVSTCNRDVLLKCCKPFGFGKFRKQKIAISYPHCFKKKR